MILKPASVIVERREKPSWLLQTRRDERFTRPKAGIATKKKYREKAAVKRRIINELQMFTVSSKAQLSKERIENLVNLL